MLFLGQILRNINFKLIYTIIIHDLQIFVIKNQQGNIFKEKG